MRSGDARAGGLNWYGSYAWYWSSRTYDTDAGYTLMIRVTESGSSISYNRWHGFPLRCLAD